MLDFNLCRNEGDLKNTSEKKIHRENQILRGKLEQLHKFIRRISLQKHFSYLFENEIGVILKQVCF